MRRRFFNNKVVEEKPVYVYKYTTTDGQMLELTGVQNHKYENGIGSFESYSISCVSLKEQASLESIIIPKGIVIIKDREFYNCYSLTSVEIPNSVTSIGNYAFYNCDGITNIKIPNSVTSIGDYAFDGCNGLTSIEIPNSVTSIGNNAFRDCSGLTSVTIPNSVTSIGNETFGSCYSLTSIEIPNSVTSIGDSAFYYCSGLTGELVIPNSVTSIGNDAFFNCNGLTSVKIGNGVKEIGERAFNRCYGLTSIVVDGNNTKYDSRENCNAIIETETNTLIKGCNNTIIPNSVTSIGGKVFEGCTGLTSVVIPNSVTSIGNNAFFNCPNLKTVMNFSNITFSKGSSSNGYVAYYADKVYNAPNGSIEGDFVFGKPNDVNTLVGYLGNATELTLPTDYNDENYTIGANVFKGNTTITSIIIPNSVTDIGQQAFYDCTNLMVVYNNSSLNFTAGSTSYGYIAYQANVVIVSSDDVWDDYVFRVVNGSPMLAAYVGNATEIVLPETYKNEQYAIGERAFRNKLITNIEIPEGVTSIGKYTFYSCDNLTNVVIPNSVTSIGDYAFEYCASLTSVEIPNSVTKIGKETFCQCIRLTSVTIPNSITSIGWRAFQYCVGLTNLTIPNSVVSIADYAFQGCSNLKTVYNYSSLNLTKGSTDYGYVAYYADEVINMQ